MLVLTRKRAETIQIGENICVKVIQTGRSSVKIGIQAPTEVRVARGELTSEPAPKGITSLADLLSARHAHHDLPVIELVAH